MGDGDSVKGERRGDGDSCFVRHHDWSEHWWKESGESKVKSVFYCVLKEWWRETGSGKVKLIVAGSLSAIAVVSFVVMVGIGDWRAGAADHATTEALEALEDDLTLVIKESSQAHSAAMQRVVDKMFYDSKETERRLDELKELILTIPGTRSPSP